MYSFFISLLVVGWSPAYAPTSPTMVADPAGDIVGTVVDSVTEKPIAGVRVQYFTGKGFDNRTPVRVLTDEQGAFRMEDVPITRPSEEDPARQVYTLFVSHEAYVPRGVRVEVVDGEEVETEIQLGPRGQ